MQINSNNTAIKSLFPQEVDWKQWSQKRPDIPFSEAVINFLSTLSASLLKDKECRIYPDIVTFAFFCRKANLLIQKKRYINEPNDTSNGSVRLGRGVLFHVAPSNVPINFGYSLVAGLLSGNSNIVRVSSKDFPQVNLIVKHLYELAKNENCKEILDRIILVKYDRNSDATNFFSSFCNVRIIWGGDATITQIRKSEIPAHSFDITFADRYSMAIIQADKLINEPNIREVAKSFYNDTYLFDQNACSAPHLIIWLGQSKNIKEAQTKIWAAIYEEVKTKYEFQAVLAVDKLVAFYRQAMTMAIEKEPTKDNMLVRVKLNELPATIDEFRCAGGYFSEYVATSLSEIIPIIKNKYQTLAYYGMDKQELSSFVAENRLIGIDRIVQFGQTSSFALTWDGYDLINILSRECTIF